MTSAELDSSAPSTFDVLGLTADVRRAIDDLGYTHPTPVQSAVFEPASRGKSLVVQARTGTGKTAAFGLPIVDQLVRTQLAAVQALILTPTRELALQVARELGALGKHRGVRILPIYGGAPMGRQVDELARGVHVVVGTPGRVLDHLGRGTLDPSQIKTLVLDESDEMLSMGFAKELHAILDHLPAERQGLFFSATIPPDIERLARNQLKDPEFVTLSSDQVGALEIAHFVYVVPGDKKRALLRVIEAEDPESAIIFCNTKDETERVAAILKDKGFDADWLNGDLEQRERERIMQRTREGKLRFLVATDVAARGIDISHLTHVINHDFPEAAEAYVHRTGRTGRAGRTGQAISLVGPRDMGALYTLRLTYKIRPIEKQLPSAQEMKTREEHDLVSTFAEAFATIGGGAADLALARRLMTHDNAEHIIAGMIRTHLGARADAGEDPAEEAAAARRAKLPPPVEPEPREREARSPRRERSDEAQSDGRDRAGGRKRGRRRDRSTDREAPRERASAPRSAMADDGPESGPSLPRFTESEAVDADSRAGDAPHASDGADDGPRFAQIFVNVGRRDGARAGDIQRLLQERAGLTRKDTGRIRVRDKMTFVGVPEDRVQSAVDALNGQIIGERTCVAEPARQKSARPVDA